MTFVETVQHELSTRGWSEAKLARDAGLDYTGLVRVLNGGRQPTLTHCVGLARALGGSDAQAVEAWAQRLAGLTGVERLRLDCAADDAAGLRAHEASCD